MRRTESIIRVLSFACISACAILLTAGCGALPTEFPHSVIGAGGEPILLDDIEAVVNDTDLSDDEKRDALRALGLEDEKLINALLTL